MNRLAALLLALAACGSSSKPTTGPTIPDQPPSSQPQPPAAGKSIGSATMLADGSIQLMLRAEGDGGMVGDAMFTYAPDHADYQMILNHVGPMKPGDSKPVPPFPQK